MKLHEFIASLGEGACKKAFTHHFVFTSKEAKELYDELQKLINKRPIENDSSQKIDSIFDIDAITDEYNKLIIMLKNSSNLIKSINTSESIMTIEQKIELIYGLEKLLTRSSYISSSNQDLINEKITQIISTL